MTDLSARELSALEDQLRQEQLMVKTFKSMAEMTSDPQLKAKYEQIASRHQGHYSRLFEYL
jgi:rubrerythrin